MGLAKESVFLLMQEGIKNPFRGKIITLGRQDIAVTYKELIKLAGRLKYPLRIPENVELSNNSGLQVRGFISDRTFFYMLGFDQVVSVDASSYEGADIIYDLNQNELPVILKESADVVLDCGTIEHVFHLPHSLENIFKMLRIGGRAIHVSPSSNHMDHGFYMFSPTLFADYYSVNNFDLQPMKIIRYKLNGVANWKIADYSPESFNPVLFSGLLDGFMYAVYCIATKNNKSSYNQIPQQSFYKNGLWKERVFVRRFQALKNIIKRFPFLFRSSIFCLQICNRMRLKWKFNALK